MTLYAISFFYFIFIYFFFNLFLFLFFERKLFERSAKLLSLLEERFGRRRKILPFLLSFSFLSYGFFALSSPFSPWNGTFQWKKAQFYNKKWRGKLLIIDVSCSVVCINNFLQTIFSHPVIFVLCFIWRTKDTKK